MPCAFDNAEVEKGLILDFVESVNLKTVECIQIQATDHVSTCSIFIVSFLIL